MKLSDRSNVKGWIPLTDPHIMFFVNRIFRCGKIWRNYSLGRLGLEGSDQPFLLALARNPGISQDELARDIYIEKSAVSRKLAVLEKNGYVTRTPAPEDKRVLLVYPTRKALDILPDLRATMTDWNRTVAAGLTPEEQETLERLLDKVMHNAMDWVDGREKEGNP